jgi:Tfp pilus assembly protein PilV
MRTQSFRANAGFTLVEALIALVITAFGMLGLAGMQMMMSRNAEVAKQRSEATRVAEAKLEELRSFTQIATGAGVVSWDGLTSGSDTQTSTETNTTYTRTWTLSTATTDAGHVTNPYRTIKVDVTWTDRAGVTTVTNGVSNIVTLNSVISQTDPADSGALAFPLPANTTIKRPKNRSLNIPIPSKQLTDGNNSVYSTSSFSIVFNNDSGYVTKKCNPVTDVDLIATESQLTGCVDFDGYVLSGYITKTMASFPSALGINETDLASRLEGDAVGIDCAVETAENQNTEALLSDYKFYLCVIPVAIPVADGGSWSGRVHLSGMNTGTDYLVCRLQYPTSATGTSNQRNVQPYTSVAESLDNQNYIITTSNSCPSVTNGTTSLATIEHQNCRSSNPNSNSARATDCPAT